MNNLDAKIALSETELRGVTGGTPMQSQGRTNNLVTTSKKNADKIDAYIRS